MHPAYDHVTEAKADVAEKIKNSLTKGTWYSIETADILIGGPGLTDLLSGVLHIIRTDKKSIELADDGFMMRIL